MTPTEKRKFAKLEKALIDREETIYVLNKLIEKSDKEKNDLLSQLDQQYEQRVGLCQELSAKNAEIEKLNQQLSVLQQTLNASSNVSLQTATRIDKYKYQINALETTIKTILKYSGQ